MHANNETGYLGLCVSLPPPEDRLSPGAMACLGRWNIWAPDQHKWWKWYTIGVCHLRQVNPLPTPKLLFEGATHEIGVYANHPDHTDKVQEGACIPLMPPNVIVQDVFRSDQQAFDCAAHLFDMCLERRLILEVSGIDGARDMWFDAVREFISH